ncbi:MAG: hypothetical protein GVY31_14195 [Alphaproteobacteria bacterium]|jgi:hypothetical protein|nr:hypothetical protein [Alphaproteobacteria bacterium]
MQGPQHQAAPQQPSARAPQPEAQQPAGPARDTEQPGSAAQGVAEQIGWIEEEAAFVLPLGAGVRLGPDVLGEERRADIPLTAIPDIPGLSVAEAAFNRRSNSRMVELTGTTAIPLVRDSAFRLRFSRQGTPSGFDVRTSLALDWLDNPDLRLRWTADGGLTTEVTVEASQFVPAAARRHARAEGDLTLGIANGQLSGDIDTTITIPNIVEGHFQGAFGEDGLSASVELANKAEFLGDLSAQGRVDAAGQLSATLTKSAGEMAAPIPGLQFNGGTLSVSLNNDGTLSGGITDLAMQYGTFADTTVTFTIEGAAYTGSADLNLNIPGLSEASGRVQMAEGALSGAFTLGRDDFPEGLPLQNGTITGRIGPTGAFSFEGSVGISLGPAGTGQMTASYAEEGGFSIGATFDLSVPGMQTASFTIAYDGTDITGEGELAVDPEYLHGIEGRVRITYAEGRWAGETTLGYTADNGKLSGEITVRVRQAEDDSLKVGGEGEVTAQIAPRLSGTLRAEILEEGGIDVSGEITVTEPLEMFPEQRFERELLNVSQNIPLWAILVAVLRIRAGVRAGIGPGVFRDITVSGSYTIGQEGEPSFSITGEMFIPAFVEGYVGFGAGLGASVVLGSLTGGIEAMGTAGLYGAISVVPELAYEDGDYSIEGVATMAAGARLKLSLNAWAEVEALWVTVWDRTWELASVTMPIGPDLGLEARMNYTFGSPEPPTLEFNSSDVDTDSLIQDAMPEDGPPSAGVRDEVRNEARWQGAQRAAGRDADAVPPELQDQATEQEAVPEPRAGTAPDGPGAPPPGRQGPNGANSPPQGQQATDASGQPVDPAAAHAQNEQAATPDPAAAGTVPEDQVPPTEGPRHGRISVRMLDEPPVPMPRTKEQQVADVQAAARLVREIARSGETTDALDNYFPRIKERFKLGQIGYVESGDRIAVLVKVNSEEKVTISEEIQYLDQPLVGGSSPAESTKIRYSTVDRTFTSDTASATQSGMGISMTADPLTPFHGQGSGPKSRALQNVFALLETQGETGSHGYIKGHLLNDNLGGPGEDRNLFPITQTANTRHSSMVEETAKELVNDRHYWVRYKVDMQETETIPYEDRQGVDRIAINALIKARLEVLKTDGTARNVKSVEIPSVFNFQRGNADMADKTRRQLQDTVDAGGPDATPAQAELDRRERLVADFDAAPQTQTTETQDDAVLEDLRAENTTEGRQSDIAQEDVLLSSARSGTDTTIRLLPNTITALRALSVYGGGDRPFAGAATLSKRLSDATIGTSSHDVLLSADSAAVAAARASPTQDISTTDKLTQSEKDVVRQVNTNANAAAIKAIVDRFVEEKRAADRLAEKSGNLTRTDMAYFTRKMSDARPTDRVAFAALVAADYGTRDSARDAMRDMGIWDSSNAFYTSLRTKVLALPN